MNLALVETSKIGLEYQTPY